MEEVTGPEPRQWCVSEVPHSEGRSGPTDANKDQKTVL